MGPGWGAGGRGEKCGHQVVLTATPGSPLTPFLPSPSPFLSLFSLSSQIETTQLEPEIARATSSRTVVYNKGL